MTAVEWLDEQIQERIIAQDVVARKMIIEISMEDYMEFKKQAKEMHKQEIINAFNNEPDCEGDGDRYYTENYTELDGKQL